MGSKENSKKEWTPINEETEYDIRPFIHPYKPLSFWDIIFVMFGTIFFLIPRLIISLIFFPSAAFCTWIAMLGNRTSRYEAFPTWRRYLVQFMTGLWCRCGYEWGLNVKIKRFGRNFDCDNTTIVCNHLGYFDIVWAFGEFMPCPVGKNYVLEVPFIGYIGKAVQTVAVFTQEELKKIQQVDSDFQPTSATEAIRKRQTEMKKPDNRYPPLFLFPEGTTSNGKYMLRLRTGAFLNGAPIKPIAIKMVGDGPSLSWETIPFWYHVWRCLSHSGYEMEVHYLDTYFPSEEEKQNPRLFADNVGKLMAEAIGVEYTTASYEGKMALHSLIRKGKYKWWDIPIDRIPKSEYLNENKKRKDDD